MTTPNDPKSLPNPAEPAANDAHDTDPTAVFVRTLGEEPTSNGKHPEIPLIRPGKPASRTSDEPHTGDAAAQANANAGEAALEGSDAEAYAALKAKRAERRRKKLIRRGIIAGTLVVLIVGGVVVFNMATAAPEQEMEPVTDLAIEGTFTTQVDAKGTLQPISSTIITPEVDGQIESVNVSAGQAVKAGDVLMTIKNPDLDRAVADADRALRQAKSELSAAQQALQETKRLASVPVAEPGMGGADTAGAQQAVTSAQVAVETAQAAYNDAVAKAALRTVHAPADGSIVALNAQVGQDLSRAMGDGASSGPLMQIADLSRMKVTVQVDEEDIASVAVDQTATITCPAFEDIALTGRVVAIASVATGGEGAISYDGSSSPTFAVDILIEAPDARLKPGMTAEVTLTTQQLDQVVMVPTTALLTDDGETYYVQVETDAETHEAERRDVTVVAKNDDMAVVGRPSDAGPEVNPDMPSAPVADGDVIVIAGGMDLGSSDEAMADGMGGGMAVM